jgi:hypothetical protein
MRLAPGAWPHVGFVALLAVPWLVVTPTVGVVALAIARACPLSFWN